MHNGSFKDLQRAFLRVHKPERRAIREAIKKHLFEEYRHKRLWTIRQHPEERISNAELIVVNSPAQFYKQVIKRFATVQQRMPNVQTFERKFREQSFKIR